MDPGTEESSDIARGQPMTKAQTIAEASVIATTQTHMRVMVAG